MLSIKQATEFLLDNTAADFRNVQPIGRGWWSVIATTRHDYELLRQCADLMDIQPIRVLTSGAVHLRFRFNSPLIGSPIALPGYHIDLRTEGNKWRWSVSFIPNPDSTLVLIEGGLAFTYDDASSAAKQAIALHWRRISR